MNEMMFPVWMTFVIEINWSVFKPERETVCDCEWEKKESNKHTKTETQFTNSRNNFFCAFILHITRRSFSDSLARTHSVLCVVVSLKSLIVDMFTVQGEWVCKKRPFYKTAQLTLLISNAKICVWSLHRCRCQERITKFSTAFFLFSLNWIFIFSNFLQFRFAFFSSKKELFFAKRIKATSSFKFRIFFLFWIIYHQLKS